MKKIVDLSQKPKNAKGEEIGNQTLAEITADVLAGSPAKENVLKLYCVMTDLATGDGKIALDDADINVLRGAIENAEGLMLLGRAQILRAIDSAEPMAQPAK